MNTIATHPNPTPDNYDSRDSAITQHTPGPWSAIAGQRCDDCATYIVQAADHREIVAVLDSYSSQLDEANARLIAAAPDLLTVCETVYELNAVGRITVNDSAAYQVIVELAAAIAAATKGGAQ